MADGSTIVIAGLMTEQRPERGGQGAGSGQHSHGSAACSPSTARQPVSTAVIFLVRVELWIPPDVLTGIAEIAGLQPAYPPIPCPQPSEPEKYSIDEMIDRLKNPPDEEPIEKGELVTRADGSQAIRVRKRKRRSPATSKGRAQTTAPRPHDPGFGGLILILHGGVRGRFRHRLRQQRAIS